MVALLPGCGGGAGNENGGASLSLRAVWQRPSSAAPPRQCPSGTPGVGFDSPFPQSVVLASVTVASDNGDACCVAFDPCDAAFRERRIVLTGLPEGTATVTLAGFPTDQVSPPGPAHRCTVKEPAGLGSGCDGQACGTGPSFVGSSQPLRLAVKSTPNDAGVIAVTAQPFLLNPTPGCGGQAAENPVPVGFVLAVPNPATTQTPAPVVPPITISVSQSTSVPPEPTPYFLEERRTSCNDDGDPDCSGGTLDVSGTHIMGRIIGLQPGRATIDIRGEGINLDFSFTAMVGPPTVTPTATGPTPTATPTATPTPSPSRTATDQR